MNANTYANVYLHQAAQAVALTDPEQVGHAAELLLRARDMKKTAWIIGNGGSAATAGHFANDLLKMGRMKAVAVPLLVPDVTAYGNDEGWDQMYSLPYAALRESQDILVAISCSGNSRNVLEAVALVDPAYLIVLTGDSRKVNNLAQRKAQAMIVARSFDIRLQEDAHMAICHAIASYLRDCS